MVVFSNEESCHSEEGKQNQWEPAELVPAKPNDGFITWSDKSLMSDKKNCLYICKKKKKVSSYSDWILFFQIFLKHFLSLTMMFFYIFGLKSFT